jgi:hypothetical protein
VTGAGAVLLVIVCSIVAGIAIKALARLFQDPFLKAGGRRNALPSDIDRALAIFSRACVLHGLVYIASASILA